MLSTFIFVIVTGPTESYTLSLHDALPISVGAQRPLVLERHREQLGGLDRAHERAGQDQVDRPEAVGDRGDRKSTRLNSSHMSISYAVFCLKKKKIKIIYTILPINRPDLYF